MDGCRHCLDYTSKAGCLGGVYCTVGLGSMLCFHGDYRREARAGTGRELCGLSVCSRLTAPPTPEAGVQKLSVSVTLTVGRDKNMR